MCLYTKQIMPIKARKLIKVYKVITFSKNGSYAGYRTPCCFMPIKPWRNYTAESHHKGLLPEGKCMLYKGFPTLAFHPKNIYVNIISGGFIHTFISKEKAKEYAVELANCRWFKRNHRWAIMECAINVGTLYYKSYDGTEIASRSLTTLKIIQKQKK